MLAAARDWAKIGSAMDAVFTHLPKVRQSRFYDLDRLARLVEATTLNLRERMEGTLRESYKGNGIVLSLNYYEYEKRGRMRRRAGEARNETPAQ
eukprot:scaffold32428_cov72-Skeletonema_dohrnii-CCMP3373.AAC.1